MLVLFYTLTTIYCNNILLILHSNFKAFNCEYSVPYVSNWFERIFCICSYSVRGSSTRRIYTTFSKLSPFDGKGVKRPIQKAEIRARGQRRIGFQGSWSLHGTSKFVQVPRIWATSCISRYSCELKTGKYNAEDKIHRNWKHTKKIIERQ